MEFIDLRHHDGGVSELVLNRPEKLNALNGTMLEEFSTGLRELDDREETRVVLLRGEGRAFSVGYDVAGSGKGAAENGRSHDAYQDWRRLRRNLERWLEVWDLPKPVVASIHGHCIGGATMLSVCADVTLVADDARIAWPSIPLGGGLLSPVSLWVTGMKKARELSYVAGSDMSGREAVDLGWANRAVPSGDLYQESLALARQIALMPSSLLRLKKLALNRVMETQGFRTAFLYGAEWDAIAHAVPEHHVMRDKINEVGLKGAISWYNEGGDLGSVATDTADSDDYL